MFRLSLLVLPLCLVGCGSSNMSNGSDAGVVDSVDPARGLPLLPPGQHPAMIVGFSGVLPDATIASTYAHFQEAIDLGMTVGRVQVDWLDLEPAPGQFELDELREQLAEQAESGLRPWLLLSTFDNEGALIPPDLAELVAEGMPADSEEITNRFALLLDRVVPLLVEHGGWSIAVLNEPANFLDDVENDAQRPMIEATVNFLKAARLHVHAIDSRVAVAATLRDGNTLLSGNAYAEALIAETDVASFNFYCNMESALGPVSEPNAEAIGRELDELIELAGGRDVVIQELGCHAGYEDQPSITDATPELQRRYLETVYAEIARHPKIRTAVWFTLIDHDPATAKIFGDQLRDEGFDELGELIEETLLTSGLLRHEDGSERPAWDSMVNVLELNYGAR